MEALKRMQVELKYENCQRQLKWENMQSALKNKIRTLFFSNKTPDKAQISTINEELQIRNLVFIRCLKLKIFGIPGGLNTDAKGLLKTAIRDNSPVIFFEHRQCYAMQGEVSDDPDFTIPFGKADVKRLGKDITIVTYSYMVHLAFQAAYCQQKVQ